MRFQIKQIVSSRIDLSVHVGFAMGEMRSEPLRLDHLK